jgi:hypothetical protein
MKVGKSVGLDNQAFVGLQEVVQELRAIKRLLALSLLRGGESQQQVAKAAGVATLAINQLANGRSRVKKAK